MSDKILTEKESKISILMSGYMKEIGQRKNFDDITYNFIREMSKMVPGKIIEDKNNLLIEGILERERNDKKINKLEIEKWSKSYLKKKRLKFFKERLLYRDQNYFNEEDEYIFFDLNRFFISRVQLHNGIWFTIKSLQIKCDTIESIAFREILGNKVHLTTEKGEIIKGTIQKCLSGSYKGAKRTPTWKFNDLGIGWDNGPKEYLPHYWNNINTLEIINLQGV